MPHFAVKSDHVAVIGAGIIGLACSLELAKRCTSVTLYDDQPVDGSASRAAAGMLAPAFEAGNSDGKHPRLFDLCHKSACLWGSWVRAVEQDSGLPVAYQAGPSLAVATSKTDYERLSMLATSLRDHPARPEWLSPPRLANRFPGLGRAVHGGFLLPGDGQVDNRAVIRALLRLCHANSRITVKIGKAPLRCNDKGMIGCAGHTATLICAGWRSPHIIVNREGKDCYLSQLIPDLAAIQPCGGQMLAVERLHDAPQHTIRAGDVYIVPKAKRLIIGATVEPGKIHAVIDNLALDKLKNRADAIWPALSGASIVEKWAGIRPQTSDSAPLLGLVNGKGLYVAAGHYRNGILLAPITAQIMANMIVGDKTSALARAFTPGRFAPKQPPAQGHNIGA